MEPAPDCDCKETTNHASYNTWNRSCNLSVIFVLLLICLLYSLSQLGSSTYRYLAVGCAIAILLLVAFVQNPLYSIPSAVFTATQYSPAYLPSKEFFPDYVYLEEENAFRSMKDEVTDLLFKTSQYPSIQTIPTGKVLPLKSGKTMNTSLASKLPFLGGFLENHPDIVSCSLRIIKAGSSVSLSEKSYKGIVKYTLPIHLSKQKPFSFLCVNGKKCEWEEGHGVLWDGNFSNKVHNRSIQQCVVVDMDIIRPLPGLMNKVNRSIIPSLYR
jgi:Aspartyl/Asparaginyl beta-hydroxylase